MSPGKQAPRTREARPLGKGSGSLEGVADAAPILGDLAAVREAYVIAVVTETTPVDGADPARSRRTYLSLHSATKAVRRAEQRGQRAALILCRLVPVQGDLESAGWAE